MDSPAISSPLLRINTWETGTSNIFLPPLRAEGRKFYLPSLFFPQTPVYIRQPGYPLCSRFLEHRGCSLIGLKYAKIRRQRASPILRVIPFLHSETETLSWRKTRSFNLSKKMVSLSMFSRISSSTCCRILCEMKLSLLQGTSLGAVKVHGRVDLARLTVKTVNKRAQCRRRFCSQD